MPNQLMCILVLLHQVYFILRMDEKRSFHFILCVDEKHSFSLYLCMDEKHLFSLYKFCWQILAGIATQNLQAQQSRALPGPAVVQLM